MYGNKQHFSPMVNNQTRQNRWSHSTSCQAMQIMTCQSFSGIILPTPSVATSDLQIFFRNCIGIPSYATSDLLIFFRNCFASHRCSKRMPPACYWLSSGCPVNRCRTFTKSKTDFLTSSFDHQKNKLPHILRGKFTLNSKYELKNSNERP